MKFLFTPTPRSGVQFRQHLRYETRPRAGSLLPPDISGRAFASDQASSRSPSTSHGFVASGAPNRERWRAGREQPTEAGITCGLSSSRQTTEENFINIWPSFAQESVFAAELAHEPRQREIWTRLAVMWASAAAWCHHVDAGAMAKMLPISAATRLEPPRG